MAQVLPSNRRASFTQGLLGGLTQSAPDALQQLIARREQMQQLQAQQEAMQQEDEALASQGINTRGVRNQKLRELITQNSLKSPEIQQKKFANDEATQKVREAFGDKTAEIYSAATEGGKTELLKLAIESRMRGIDLNKILGSEESQTKLLDAVDTSAKNADEAPISFEIPEQDKGLTPKEKFARQEKRYNTNFPIYQEFQNKIKGYEDADETISKLQELNDSGKLPSGIGRWNVGIKEGSLQIPALANEETQLYIKTVNEFLSKAKDTFGSRVTNFELDRFLQRLPTLANTEEGRREILKQMSYLNKINQLYYQEIDDVIEKAGGIRHIDIDQAERIAKKSVKPKIAAYKKEFTQVAKDSQDTFSAKVKEMRSKVPANHVLVEKDGLLGYIPNGDLQESKKEGYKPL